MSDDLVSLLNLGSTVMLSKSRRIPRYSVSVTESNPRKRGIGLRIRASGFTLAGALRKAAKQIPTP